MRFDADWPVHALGDLAETITVGHVGSMVAEYVPRGVPFLRSQNVRPFALDLSQATYIGQEFHTRLAKSALHAGDVVIVRTGVPGVAAVIPDDLGPANCSDLVIVRPGPRFDPRFLCYAVNVLAREHVSAHLVGAVQQHFNVGSARVMQLPVPSIAEQRAIAGAVGALDAKIALNNRMNRSLEAMAAALFQSWFVDFDPVTAKTQGRRAPYVPDVIAKQFPESFDETTPDRPRGWQEVNVGDLVEVAREAVAPASMPHDVFDHYSIPAYDDRLLPRHESGSMIRSNKFRITPEALLVSKLNPDTPRIWWPAPPTHDRSVCSTEFLVCTPRKGIPREYLYLLFRSTSFVDSMASLVTGTSNSHQRVRPDDFMNLRVVRAPDGCLQGLAHVVAPLLAQARANLLESSTLVTLRDTILPQLLSGAVRLHDAERAVAAAV